MPSKPSPEAASTSPRERGTHEVELRFDNAAPLGSPEHFYHFLWGYLLPAIHEICLKRDLEKVARERYLVQACGPVMDPLFSELAEGFGLELEFVPGEQIGANDRPHILLPRWDWYLLRPHLLGEANTALPMGARMGARLRQQNPSAWSIVSHSTFLEDFRSMVDQTRQIICLALGIAEDIGAESGQPRYLIIRRSPEHHFYTKEGGAQVKTSGAARRALRGAEDAARKLQDEGFSVELYECGGNSLAGQISAFRQCRGVAMIRGAEISNLIWMRPGSSVVVVTPRPMSKGPPPHDGLAELLELELVQEITDEGAYPRLSPELLAGVWGSLE